MQLALMLIITAVLHSAVLADGALVVTNTNDSGPGSLRAAITTANESPGEDMITFSIDGTIELEDSLPAVSDNLTIDGAGQVVTISGGTDYQVLFLNSEITLNINALTIADGRNNRSLEGAGIYNDGGMLILTNSHISGNTADHIQPGVGDAAGIFNDGGTVTVSNSAFVDNSADGHGGAIFSWHGTLIIAGSSFENNDARDGAAIFSIDDILIVTGSTFTGNNAQEGSGIFASESTLSVTGTAFADQYGSSIFNSRGVAAVETSTFSGTVSGGIHNYLGTMTVTNSTFSGNTGSDWVPEYGSGIRNINGTVSVSYSSFSGNTSAIWNEGGTTTLHSSIVANSLIGDNCVGEVFNGGFNIDSGSSCGWGAVAGSMSDTDPLLDHLASNGGPAQTLALLPGSPAIDGVGEEAECPYRDQRGIRRPIGPRCDIGAYEAPIDYLFMPAILFTASE